MHISGDEFSAEMRGTTNVRSNGSSAKARMFERRAEEAIDPISQRHYREMAAHYRSLAVEHLEVGHDEPAH